ncbi:hypothetical protein ACX0G7_00645 [Flavitalea antarctica]
MQLYAGFFELERKGIIKLKLKLLKQNQHAYSLINVLVNNKYRVIYDTLDGLTWIHGDEQANLAYFKKTYEVDFYFKRSFNSLLHEHRPKDCKVFPLGLNYNVQPKKNLLLYSGSLKNKVKYVLKTNKLLKQISAKRFYYEEDFEFLPIKPKTNNILFLTRLWDPNEAKSERSKEFRIRINKTRVECIERCRDTYGVDFTGGLYREKFALKNFPDLIMDDALTNKSGFLKAVKDHAICIATTGLHKSIGWKMAEYVAASRAIVSEPLNFDLPGQFSIDENYCQFDTADQLIEQIDKLRGSQSEMLKLMINNFHYYNNFVKPERLILNSLITVLNNS